MANFDDVNKPSKAYLAMAKAWRLGDDLRGGTARMREAGTAWLPKEAAESDEAYGARLSRSFLYGATKDTIEKFVSKPFSRRVGVKGQEKLDPVLAALEDNADMLGSTITEFSKAVFRDGLQHGLSFVFVDYSKVATTDARGNVVTPNASEERQAGARPYFQHFHSSRVIAAKPVTKPDGSVVPSQVRVRETRIEPDGPFGEKEVKYVRVYEENSYQEFREGADGHFSPVAPPTPTRLGGIPIVPYYVTQEGFFVACPPFEDLEWENLGHWQNSSDQNNILHFARVPILHWSGVDDENESKPLEIGPSRVIKSRSTASKLEYVEPTGAAISSGHTDLQAREARMEVLGLSPAMERVQDQTAEARKIDDSNARSAIQSWIRGIEGVIERAYRIAAQLANKTLPEEFGIDIFQDFGIGQRAQQDIAALAVARAARDIDHETYLYELRRRGVLDESTDLAAVIAKTQDEGPALPEMTSAGNPPGTPPESPPPQVPPAPTKAPPTEEVQPPAKAA